MEEFNKNDLATESKQGFMLKCTCGNELFIHSGKYKLNDKDEYSIIPFNGVRAVSIQCDKCENEVIILSYIKL